MRLSQTDLVSSLTVKLGGKLVAYIVDRSPSAVSRWGDGAVNPGEAALVPLRNAWQVIDMLERHDADATIRAWFMGMNPQLDDLSPAEALREGQNREVMAAARSFRSGG